MINLKLFIFAFVILNAVTAGKIDGRLPSFNIVDNRVTLSGFSSGGSFAQMFQISHSSLIHGIAVFSHTFYRCGPPSGIIDDYDKVCTKLFNYTANQLYSPQRVHKDIETYAANSYIDNPRNLRNKFLYVYTGLQNFLFSADQSLGIIAVYEKYIANPSRIMTRVQDAELVLPTNNPNGGPCKELNDKKAFIGNCGFSGAYEALNFLHGSDQPLRSPGGPNPSLAKNLRTFDQSEFTKDLKAPQLYTLGYYYVPSGGCGSRCTLHFYFHGCTTGAEFEGTNHIVQSGYLEVAEANNFVIIFPQVAKSMPQNDIGCWDTFGISGPLYATKRGDQITAVKRMLDRIRNSPQSIWKRPSSSHSSSSSSSSTSNGHFKVTSSVSSGPFWGSTAGHKSQDSYSQSRRDRYKQRYGK